MACRGFSGPRAFRGVSWVCRYYFSSKTHPSSCDPGQFSESVVVCRGVSCFFFGAQSSIFVAENFGQGADEQQ